MEENSQPLPAEAEAEDQEGEDQTDPTEAGAEVEAKPSESAPDSGKEATQEQKVTFTPEQQEVFDKAIAKKTFERREAERQREDVRKELERLQAQLPKDGRPQVPPVPDPYDADYEQKLAARDKALTEAAAYDAKQKAVEEQQVEAQRQQQKAFEDDLIKSATTYTERAEKFGLDIKDLQSSGDAIARYGISDDLTLFILKDEQGPLLTSYLARNPQVLETMQGMSPLEMGAYLASDVKPQLATARTQTTAPAPADVLDGGGSPSPERGPKGATFE